MNRLCVGSCLLALSLVGGVVQAQSAGPTPASVPYTPSWTARHYLQWLGDHAALQRSKVFDSLYDSQRLERSVAVQRIQRQFSHLPDEVANELLLNVLPAEQQLASEQGQLSLRLKQTAREALHEWRITRAWEGLYLPANANLDSYRLALHSLEKLPGLSPEVRLEIRNLAFDGVLIDSVGAPAATVRKVLVRTRQDRFLAFDAQGHELHGASDFYHAVLQALPDAERKSLGLGIGEGQRLRSHLQQSSISRAELRGLLHDASLRTAVENPVKPGYVLIEERLSTAGEASLEDRYKTLYPQATAEHFQAFSRASGSPEAAVRLNHESE